MGMCLKVPMRVRAQLKIAMILPKLENNSKSRYSSTLRRHSRRMEKKEVHISVMRFLSLMATISSLSPIFLTSGVMFRVVTKMSLASG